MEVSVQIITSAHAKGEYHPQFLETSRFFEEIVDSVTPTPDISRSLKYCCTRQIIPWCVTTLLRQFYYVNKRDIGLNFNRYLKR